MVQRGAEQNVQSQAITAIQKIATASMQLQSQAITAIQKIATASRQYALSSSKDLDSTTETEEEGWIEERVRRGVEQSIQSQAITAIQQITASSIQHVTVTSMEHVVKVMALMEYSDTLKGNTNKKRKRSDRSDNQNNEIRERKEENEKLRLKLSGVQHRSDSLQQSLSREEDHTEYYMDLYGKEVDRRNLYMDLYRKECEKHLHSDDYDSDDDSGNEYTTDAYHAHNGRDDQDATPHSQQAQDKLVRQKFLRDEARKQKKADQEARAAARIQLECEHQRQLQTGQIQLEQLRAAQQLQNQQFQLASGMLQSQDKVNANQDKLNANQDKLNANCGVLLKLKSRAAVDPNSQHSNNGVAASVYNPSESNNFSTNNRSPFIPSSTSTPSLASQKVDTDTPRKDEQRKTSFTPSPTSTRH